jgi:tetratricopeptide (TPR) repeat protein
MMMAYSERSLISRIGSYLQIVSKDPGSTAFVPLAEAYRQVGLLDDALEVTRIGTQRLPHFSPGFSTMGRVLGQMGRIDEAVNAYVKALSLDHQSQSALVGLARLHLIRGERDQARTLLQQAKEFHPGDDKITDMLKALDLPRPWEQIKPAAPEQTIDSSVPPAGEAGAPIPTATLAEIYAKQGLHAQAIKIYQDILDRHPDHATAQERLHQLRDAAAPAPATAESTAQRSPLAILQSWLSAIQQRRADVS